MRGVHIRGDLAALPTGPMPHRPGGAIRLDLNEVPDPPLPTVLAAITTAAQTAHRYPDVAATGLRERIGQHLGVTADRIAVGCGSTSLCQQLVQATCDPDDEVVFGWPSFDAYPHLVRVVGARSRPVPTTAGHRLDLNAMAGVITERTRLIFVCNPNNPTGTALRREELLRLLDAVPPTVLVALDEAYREFVTDPEVPDGLTLLDGRDNLVVLRTFSKAYGLAGLRVGYCVSSPEITTALRKVCVPFSVNAVAQAAAIAALDAADQVRDYCATIAAERDWVHADLRNAEYDAAPSQTNFLWLPLGDHSLVFAEHCLRHDIVVRAWHRGGVRVSIGTVEENDAFVKAARTFRRPARAALDAAIKQDRQHRHRIVNTADNNGALGGVR